MGKSDLKGTVLDRIASSTRRRIALMRENVSEDVLRSKAVAAAPVRDAEASLKENGLRVIAEFKRRSPSEGPLAEDLDPATVAREYEIAGAAGMSVLTEPEFFGGSIKDLKLARGAVELPILMKDFIVEPYQLLQARVAGADMVLLIVALLGPEPTSRMLDVCRVLGLHALVEVHTDDELSAALDAGARIVGVNNRNLKTLHVNLRVGRRLAEKAAGRAEVLVCESGLTSRADLENMKEAGFDAFLIGTHLIKSGHPGDALKALLG